MKYERIKNPKTNRIIYVNGETYNQLLKNYTVDYLNSLPRVYTTIAPKSPKYKNVSKIENKIENKTNEINIGLNMNNDIFNYTFLDAEPHDIINLCHTNKELDKFCTNEFWKLKIKHDYPIVKLKSEHYKKEYIILTNLYKKAVDTLHMIQLYKENHLNFRYIVFMDNGVGFSKLDELYWMPDNIKDQFSDAQRLRLSILSTSQYHYHLLSINISTMNSRNIKISEKDVIDLFWLLMYHYNIDIRDFGKNISFLYDNLLKSKGKERNIRLRCWERI